MSRLTNTKRNIASRRNPNHERSMLLLNIIILCIITLTAIGIAAFFYLRMQSAEVRLRDMNSRLNGTDGQEKTLFTAEELAAQREDARISGEESGENGIKTLIQTSYESGKSTLTMLRQLFPENIVVSNQGRFYFYPVLQELPQNTFSSSDFGLDENGLLSYLGSDPAITLTHGIQVSADSGMIDWTAVAADHVDYAMIYIGGRDADGVLTEDDAFARNVSGAHNVGLSVGLYYTMSAATTKEAQEDAEWLIDALEAYAADIDGYAAILVRVPEAGDRMSGVSREIWTGNLKIVSNTLKLAGYRPMLFGNLTAMQMQIEPEIAADLAIWVSNIGTDLYFPYAFDMWRYSSESTVDGIEKSVARSVWLQTAE